MPRLLSNNLIQAKNLLESNEAWAWLIELRINDLPIPERYTNYDIPIDFHGNTYTPLGIKIARMEDSDAGRLTRLAAIIENVDQNIISLIENNWLIATQFPNFIVEIWPVFVNQPDEMLESSSYRFRVVRIQTNYVQALFTLIAAGINVNSTLPRRRITKSGGFDTFE